MPGHPGDHTPGWQLHTRQGSAPPPRPRSRLWPLPPVPPQVPACDPRGPASLPSPRPLRRTFLKKKKKKEGPSCTQAVPSHRAQPNPCMVWALGPVGSCLRGKGEECAKAMQGPLEEAAKIPKSVQVALGYRPGGSGGRPILSLSLPIPTPSQSPAAR